MSQYADSQLNLDNENSNWYKAFRLIKPRSLVLDVGCSSGNFGKELIEKKKCTVDGVEIDEEDAALAAKYLRNVYVINIEQDLVPAQEKYDVIFMGDVIEHLAAPVDTLKKLRQLLKPEGSLVFSIPNMSHMSVRLMFMNGRIEYGQKGPLDNTHLHFYNAEEVVRVLNASGFEVISMDSSVKPLPFEYVEEALRKLGLNPDDKFRLLAETTNSVAYQFIGLANKATVKKQELHFRSPPDITTVDDYVKKAIKEHKKNYENLEKKYLSVREAYLKAKEDIKVLQEEKVRLENMSSVRFHKKFSKLSRRNAKQKN